MVQIGKIIKQELEAQERSITWFAKKLNVDRSNVYRLFNRNSIDTAMLLRISVILKHNFFTYLSEEYEEKHESQQ